MNVRRNSVTFWAVNAILLFSAALTAQEQEVMITNPGFEDPVLADGEVIDNAPGWVTTIGGSDGIFNPDFSMYPGGSAAEGNNAAFNNGVDIRQVLSATLQPNFCYRLQVAIGRRLDEPFPGYRVELQAGGEVLVAEDSQTPAPGEWVDAAVVFNTGDSHTQLGNNLEIHLISEGVQVNFDNVRLTAGPSANLPKVRIVAPSGNTGIRQAVVGPPNAPLTAADFTASINGVPAVPVEPDPGWMPSLPTAPRAKWIASAPRPVNGGEVASVLYSFTFYNTCNTTQMATIDFTYAVDDLLGSAANPEGLYLNGLVGAIPRSGSGTLEPPATFRQENVLSKLDISNLIKEGRNDLFIYQTDQSDLLPNASGIIFQAEIKIGCKVTMSAQPVMAQFAQVAVGDGSSSSFAIHNPSQQQLTVQLEFFASNGSLIATQERDIDGMGTEVIALEAPDDPLQVGWVKITALGNFSATEFLDLVVGGEALPRVGVLPCELTRKATFFASDLDGRMTGLAIANPNVFGSAEISVQLTEPDGTKDGMFMINLLHGQHRSLFLKSEINNVIEGTVTVESSVPVCILSLIQDPQGNLTTVAVSTEKH